MGCAPSGKNKVAPVYRIILLGIGGVGKSSLIKQLRVLHSNGLSESEKQQSKYYLIKEMVIILLSCIPPPSDETPGYNSDATLLESFNISPLKLKKQCEDPGVIEALTILSTSPEVRKHVRKLSENMHSKFDDTVLGIIGNALTELWAISSVKKAFVFKASEESYGHVNFAVIKSFLNGARWICSMDYVLRDEELVKVRRETSGVHKYPFVFTKQNFVLIDSGGQQHERFEREAEYHELLAVFFIVSLEDYDKHDAAGVSRLDLSLKFFKEIIADKRLESSMVVLIFNKTDLFLERLKARRNFEKVFPDCEKAPPDSTVDDSFFLYAEHIISLFEDAMKESPLPNRKLEKFTYYVTNATDPIMVKKVFAKLFDGITNRNARMSGF